jgi:hypothetical protein
MKIISLVCLLLSLAVVYAPADAHNAAFDFGVASSVGSNIAGGSNTSVSVNAGAGIKTTADAFRTPHGIASQTITTTRSYGSSFAIPGASGAFVGGTFGGSEVSGHVVYPIK